MSWRKQGALAFGHIQTKRADSVVPEAPTGTANRREHRHPRLRRSEPAGSGRPGRGHGQGDPHGAGEISILVEKLRLLTKAIRPLPDQWSGLKDRELVLRKRYLDTTLDPQVHERFASITRMIAAIRSFLNERGFQEFHYAGDSAAIRRRYRQAVQDARQRAGLRDVPRDLARALSQALIVAGYDKVYTIGRYFRNEGIDRSHHPEFSMVETMTAYENYEYNMDLVEAMFRHVAVTAFGRTLFKVRGTRSISPRPWRRVAMRT